MTGDVLVSDVLRERLVRHVLLALSRFGPRVRRATIRLAEPANPLGGVDQRCSIRASLQDSDDQQAEAINGGFEDAVIRAAAQLATRVASALDGNGSRSHVPRAQRPPPPRSRRRRHA